MTIPVLLEPTAGGFRASTGAPLNLTAEAPTADEALAAVGGAWAAKLAAGARVVGLTAPDPNRRRELIAKLAANPAVAVWAAATNAYRAEYEAREAAADAAAGSADPGPVSPARPATRQEPAA